MSDFRARAVCRDVDPELFWPVADPGTPVFAELAAPARAVCARCPVQQECLDDVLATPASKDLWGIYAGTDFRQRAQLRKVLAAREADEADDGRRVLAPAV